MRQSRLRKRVIELMARYERFDDCIFTAEDLADELESVIDEEDYEPLTDALNDAIHDYILARHDCARYCGHTDDGSDEFIEAIYNSIKS